LLVAEAIERGSLDNVTAIVIYLQKFQQPPPASDNNHHRKHNAVESSSSENPVMDAYEFLRLESDRIQQEKEHSPDSTHSSASPQMSQSGDGGAQKDAIPLLNTPAINSQQQLALELQQRCPSPRATKTLEHFDLPADQTILQGLFYFCIPDTYSSLRTEHYCVLEKRVPHQGILLITTNYLCFYSSLFGKKTTVGQLTSITCPLRADDA
jgi:hypothetical protein